MRIKLILLFIIAILIGTNIYFYNQYNASKDTHEHYIGSPYIIWLSSLKQVSQADKESISKEQALKSLGILRRLTSALDMQLSSQFDIRTYNLGPSFTMKYPKITPQLIEDSQKLYSLIDDKVLGKTSPEEFEKAFKEFRDYRRSQTDKSLY